MGVFLWGSGHVIWGRCYFLASEAQKDRKSWREGRLWFSSVLDGRCILLQVSFFEGLNDGVRKLSIARQELQPMGIFSRGEELVI